MRILVAPDKFKGSLGAAAVAEEIAAGLHEILRDAEVTQLPIADGGEGTAEIICSGDRCDWIEADVHDACGDTVRVRYGIMQATRTAAMDASAACGLWRVPPEQRDPDLASTFGVGELLLAAARDDVAQIVIGLGGSATNDGGFGMARALGFRFLDHSGGELHGRVSELVHLRDIEAPRRTILPRIIAAADVQNPLLGPRGATRVFASQKGASADQIEQLETALHRLAEVVASGLGNDLRDCEGAGAAGGLGFGLMSFCAAEMRRGFDVVAEFTGLANTLRAHDIVVTGEGCLDRQTLDGKAPAGVAQLARENGKPVYAIVGKAEPSDELRALFTDIVPLANNIVTPAAAMQNVRPLLRERARELARGLGR